MNVINEKISSKQFGVLVVLFTIGSSILFIPSILANTSQQDAWISAIVGTFFGLSLVLLYSKIYKLYPNKSYFECAIHVLGKWFGGFVVLLTYIYFFILSSLLLWDLGNFLKTQIITITPIEVIFVLFMLVIVYAIRHGIENIARTSEIFIPWVLGMFIILVLLLIPEIDKENLLPYLEKGGKSILYGSYHIFVFPYLELIGFLMITPYVNREAGVKKAFLLGTLIGGIVLIISTLLSILVLGADFTARNTFPMYILGSKINIGGFLERVEVFVAIMWFFSIFFKLAISFFIIVVGLSNLAKLKDYRPITLPFGMLVVIMTPIMFTSALQVQAFDIEVYSPFSYVVGLFLPLLVLIAGVIKKKSEEKEKPISQ